MDLSPLWISLKTAAAATCLAFVVGIAVAHWMFSYRGKGRGLIDGLLTLPLVLPPTVVGFLLLLLLGRNSPVGQLLTKLGIRIIFSWPATVIAATVVAFPLMYRTVLAAFEQVDPDFPQAARTLGANEGTIFWQLLLPLAWPGIVAGMILAFARALGEFGATLMLAGSIPGRTQTIPIAIWFATEAGEMNTALVWTVIMVVIALGVIAGLNYWSGSQPSRQIVVLANPLLDSLWGWLILRYTAIARRAADQGSSRQRRPSHPATRCGSQLLVHLQKNLPGFTLEAAFSAAGAPLGILGASGSGKTMILRCIAGLETPNRGQIILNQRILFDAEQGINIPCRQRRIGVVFQNYALFPHMSVAQNIAFGLQKLAPAERARRLEKYLALMQLQGLEARYPHQISGGQQQRVALARALAIEPEALLLDEPFSALDTHLRSQLEKQLIETLACYEGVTLFVSHNLEEAYRLCFNLLVLCAGKVLAYGPKQDIFERPPTYNVAQLTGCKNFARAQAAGLQSIKAGEWDCTLEVVESIPRSLSYVGIRAHHLTFTENPQQENTFPCWLVQTSETPHRVTLYLKLHVSPSSAQDYHLQAEMFKEKWTVLKDQPFPWHIHLDPLRLFLMES